MILPIRLAIGSAEFDNLTAYFDARDANASRIRRPVSTTPNALHVSGFPECASVPSARTPTRSMVPRAVRRRGAHQPMTRASSIPMLAPDVPRQRPDGFRHVAGDTDGRDRNAISGRNPSRSSDAHARGAKISCWTRLMSYRRASRPRSPPQIFTSKRSDNRDGVAILVGDAGAGRYSKSIVWRRIRTQNYFVRILERRSG